MIRRVYTVAVLALLTALLGPVNFLAADAAIEWGEPHVLANAPAGSPVAAAENGFVNVEFSHLGENADEVSTIIHRSSGGWNWQPVVELQSVLLSAVIADGQGFVAVGRRGLSELVFAPSAWLSDDGLSWTEVSVPAAPDGARPATAEGPPYEGSWMTAVARGAGKLVAIGNTADGLPLAWTSTDGQSWALVSGDPFGADPALLSAIASGGSGFAVVGRRPLDADAPGGALAWWSSDGSTWSQATVDPSFGAVHGPHMSRLIATDDGYMLFGTDNGEASVWKSPNGQVWGAPERLPVLADSGHSFVFDAVSAGSTVVAVGDDTVFDPDVEDGASIWVHESTLGWIQVDPADLRGLVTLDRTMADLVYLIGDSWVVLGGTWTADESTGADIRWIGRPAGSGQFADVPSGYLFGDDIEWLWQQGITAGCNPPANDLFCPKAKLTRAQTAAFLVRALGYTDNGGGDVFIDDDGSVFEEDIDRLATAGVTRGCNPPVNDRFCPYANLNRGQMAAFLVRGLELEATAIDFFKDDQGSIFEDDINRLAAAGITAGCNPPTNDNYCPFQEVTREQMAAFLRRGLNEGG